MKVAEAGKPTDKGVTDKGVFFGLLSVPMCSSFETRQPAVLVKMYAFEEDSDSPVNEQR